MMRILIVHTWGIGDWMFFTPVIRALTESYPDIEIDVILGTPGAKQIVELYPNMHIHTVADVTKGIRGILKILAKTWRKRYDSALFTAGVSSRKADALAALIRADRKIGLLTSRHAPRFLTDVAQYDPSIHRLENNLKFLDALHIETSDNHFPFLPFETADKVIPDSILLHPGSDPHNMYKRWPIERFVSVSEKLLRRNWQVSVVLGPGETDLAQAFLPLQKDDKFTIYRGIILKEVLNVICQHEILLANDTSLGHLAAALRKRVIAIFGPGDPVQVRPYNTNCVVIRTAKNMKCMPCMLSGNQRGCAEALCMADIDEDSVIEVILEKPISAENVEILKSNS